ncbi:MAG: hypothetical protein A2Z72_00590 [Omnitrophica bacterium RBG_13_46_9]|nr:MAG: hypothetical protein A2Z72_00590 [Omnitrophica bacterium RBG_13_46_9]
MSDRKVNAILYTCFFFSGISGLIYEVLWAKYLSLIFGNTAYAHTLVLATFMGGLALGSLMLGRLVDKVDDKLGFYAWVEIGIAAFCVLTPKFFEFSNTVYLTAARNLSLNAPGIVGVKFIISALILLPPTILMGGTLPILSKFMIRSVGARGETVARLYYINSFGAVVGTLFAGFYLIYYLGLACSVTTASLINFFVGFTVLVLKEPIKRHASVTDAVGLRALIPKREEAENKREAGFSDSIIRISLVGIFVSGFVAMLYEIIWIRLLSMVLGSSAYSFSLMLAAFISGITIGAFLISKRMPDTRATFLFFGLCEIFIGISLIISLPFYGKLPAIFLKLSNIFSRTPETFLLYSAAKFLLAFMVMLPPTVFLGMTLPLVSKVASHKLEFLGRRIGSVFAFNTSGNIFGALISGLVLLPALGSKLTLELGVAINLCLGIIIISADKPSPARPKILLATMCCLAFLAYKLTIPDWDKTVFNTQLFRYYGGKSSFAGLIKGRGLADAEVLFYKDGLDATVSVLKYKFPKQLTLFVNGKADASTGNDMPTQVLCAELPLVLKPDIKDVLVVGLGSGVTCGSALLHPISVLDLVEISPSVVEANKYFVEYNYNALQDDRLNLYIEDARTFIQRNEKKYDLLINEPSNPWMSGVGALFSKEYFSDCLNRLKDGGLMVQWVQTYEMDDATFEMIVRTYASVFPEVLMWGTGIYDILLIGSKEKIVPVFNESEKRLAQQPVKEDLARIGLGDLFTLLSLQLASGETVRELVKMPGGINSDYFPILQYRAPLALYTKSVVKDVITDLDERRLAPERGKLLIGNYLQSHSMGYDNYKNFYGYISAKTAYNKDILYALVKKWHQEFPGDEDAVLAHVLYNVDFLDNAIRALDKLIAADPKFELLDIYASSYARRCFTLESFLLPEIFHDTVREIKMCADLTENKKAKFYYLLGKVYCSAKDYREALLCYEKVKDLIESKKEVYEPHELDYSAVLNEISLVYYKMDNMEKALEYATKVLALDKENPHAKAISKFIKTQMIARRSAR